SILLAALAQDVPEQDAALCRVDRVGDRWREWAERRERHGGERGRGEGGAFDRGHYPEPFCRVSRSASLKTYDLISHPHRCSCGLCESPERSNLFKPGSCRNRERGAERFYPSYPILLSSRSSDITDGSLGKYGERPRRCFACESLAVFKSITTGGPSFLGSSVFFSIGNVPLVCSDCD